MFPTILLCAAAALAADPIEQWNDFKRKFGKTYLASEEHHRFQIFKENLRQAELLNRLYPSATFGITKFSDLSQEEFATRFHEKPPVTQTVFEDIPARLSAPSSWNWADTGMIPEPRDQGGCGSCWAFCTALTVAGVDAINHDDHGMLSAQQLVDCDKNQNGCNGGEEYNSLQYVVENGLMTEEDYPYQEIPGSCKYSASDAVGTISKRVLINPRASDVEEQMVEKLYEYGPLAVAVNGNVLQFYNSGVISGDNCARILNHCVTAVGYDISSSNKYWIIQNSWGPSWGEDGMFRLEYGTDACGVADEPIYAIY